MAAAVLTSNHVNYLIWRYLQESGYGEAAVKLQRDWISDPQGLPFAQHIKTHALVVLVQKGLQYHEIEQSVIHNNHGTRSSPSSSTFFFGPDFVRGTSSPHGDASGDETAGKSTNSPRTRKHGRENSTNGLPLDMPTAAPAAKRSRRSNGTDATNGDRRGSDSMDYEPNGYLPAKAEPPEPISTINSPAEESQTVADGAGMGMGMGVGMGMGMDVDDDAPAPEHARMTLTLTNGQSVGVQSDQVTELGPETINLSVPDKNVMHTAWNPRDPVILATGGQALCRIWTISRSDPPRDISPNPNHDGNPPSPHNANPNRSNVSNPNDLNSPDSPHQNTTSDPFPRHDVNASTTQFIDTQDPSDETSLVTTLAWTPDGETLAVATQGDVSGGVGAVSLWTKNGKCIDELPAAQDMVLVLRWNPSGTHLAGVTTAGTAGSAIVIWDTQSSQAFPPVHLERITTDVAWADDRNFTFCGHGVIGNVAVDNECIVNLRTFPESEPERKWTSIQRDKSTNTIATVADEEAVIGIIDSCDRLHTSVGHDAQITAIAFQPLPDPLPDLINSIRLLVTSSLDGTIKFWNVMKPFAIIHVINIGRSTPAMAMSFNPDGNYIAVANWNRVLVWSAEPSVLPKASWKGEQGKWQGLANGIDKDSGIGEDEDGPIHSLSWDADGGKLAYGLGSQIAIINARLFLGLNSEITTAEQTMHQ